LVLLALEKLALATIHGVVLPGSEGTGGDIQAMICSSGQRATLGLGLKGSGRRPSFTHRQTVRRLTL
jgi:hypothetical protein